MYAEKKMPVFYLNFYLFKNLNLKPIIEFMT